MTKIDDMASSMTCEPASTRSIEPRPAVSWRNVKGWLEASEYLEPNLRTKWEESCKPLSEKVLLIKKLFASEFASEDFKQVTRNEHMAVALLLSGFNLERVKSTFDLAGLIAVESGTEARRAKRSGMRRRAAFPSDIMRLNQSGRTEKTQ
jgi:hypothetical protein